MKLVEMSGTCDGSGDLVLASTIGVTGYLEKINYAYIDGATGSDFVITATANDGGAAEAILTVTDAGTAALAWFPRSLANKVADASAFTDVAEKIFIADGLFSVTVAQGGVSKDFKFIFVVSDE